MDDRPRVISGFTFSCHAENEQDASAAEVVSARAGFLSGRTGLLDNTSQGFVCNDFTLPVNYATVFCRRCDASRCFREDLPHCVRRSPHKVRQL